MRRSIENGEDLGNLVCRRVSVVAPPAGVSISQTTAVARVPSRLVVRPDLVRVNRLY
jgi:hypothetical protein